MKKLWVISAGLVLLLIGGLAYKEMSVQEKHYDLAVEKEYAQINNNVFYDLMKKYPINGNKNDLVQKNACYIMASFDMSKVKNKVMDCLARNKSEDYSKCEKILTDRLESEIRKQEKEDIDATDVYLAEILYKVSSVTSFKLSDEGYKNEAIESIFMLSMARRNLYNELNSLKECIGGDPFENPESSETCVYAVHDNYETVAQKVIEDYKLAPDTAK